MSFYYCYVIRRNESKRDILLAISRSERRIMLLSSIAQRTYHDNNKKQNPTRSNLSNEGLNRFQAFNWNKLSAKLMLDDRYPPNSNCHGSFESRYDLSHIGAALQNIVKVYFKYIRKLLENVFN